jgi:curved DNA-binding protein CbpA
MAGTKNPFEIFGLTPEIADSMKEKDLFNMVKSLYRSLQKVYHPDKNAHLKRGQAKMADLATELNLAFEKLDLTSDAESFRHYQRLYAGRTKRGIKKQFSTLANDLEEARKNRGHLAGNFFDYILEVHSVNHKEKSRKGYATPVSLMPKPVSLKLGLNDMAINHYSRSCDWELGSNYKEIIFNKEGKMSIRPVGRTRSHRANYTCAQRAENPYSLYQRHP